MPREATPAELALRPGHTARVRIMGDRWLTGVVVRVSKKGATVQIRPTISARARFGDGAIERVDVALRR